MSLTRFGDQDKKYQTSKIITSTWSDNTNNLKVNYTSSTNNFLSPTSSGQFYLNVYHKDPSSDADAEIQYAVAYGHRAGSGSPDFTNDTGSFGKGGSRVIYGQYRNLIYGDENEMFTFGTHVPDDIYVLNVNRARYKNQLSLNGVMSGSSVKQIAGSSSYGLYYPDSGIAILNPDNFISGSTDQHFAPFPARNTGVTGNTDKNNEKLFRAISTSGHFIIDSEEIITSRYYFVRARNYEYNYSTNPSFQDESGNVLFQSMINSPKTYITTVGLYNDNNELLAVAKMSQPIAKDPTKEALIRVKLDY